MLAHDRHTAVAPRRCALAPWLTALLLAVPAASHAAPKPSTPTVVVTPTRVVAANLHAASSIYRAAALEEMRLFAVADRIAALVVAGLLPVGKATRDRIDDYVGGETATLDESARRRIYGHVLGGSPSANVHLNDDFDPLLARFLVATRKLGKAGKAARAEELHRSARALALNLSNHGYGATAVAAGLLARKIELAQAIVADPQVLATYEVTGPLELVERVAEQEFGVSVDAEALRGRAQAGAAVISWLGKVAEPLSTTGGAPALAEALVADRVPESVRGLDRTVSAKHAPKAVDPGVPPVHALCFDAQQRLVDCLVENADE